MGIFFDDNHDGIKDPGEDVILGSPRPCAFGGRLLLQHRRQFRIRAHYRTGRDRRTNPPGGGTDDIVAGRTDRRGRTVTFEFRHPLCSPTPCTTSASRRATRSAWTSCTPSRNLLRCTRARSHSTRATGRDLTISGRSGGATGHIVFESNRDGKLEIYRMNADGSAQTRLTNNPATDNVPSISPDGTKVAFSSDRDGKLRHLRDEHRRHRPHAADDRRGHRASSPPGRPTARRSPTRQQHRAVRHLRHRTPTARARWTSPTTPPNEASASWSPDGTQLAFMSDRDGQRRGLPSERGRLRNADAADERARIATADPTGRLTGRRSPSSASAPEAPAAGSVWTINASDGSGAANLTNGSIFDSRPELVAGRYADRVRPRRRRTELQGLDGARRRYGPGQPDAHRRPQLVPRLGADRDGT